MITRNQEINLDSDVSRLFLSRNESRRSNTEGIFEMVNMCQQLKVNDSVDPKKINGDQTKER